MRFLIQIILTTFFIVFFIISLVAATFKFGLFNYTFITNSLEKHNVYSELSGVIKNNVDNQISIKGGNKNDIAVLTDLITPENIKDFVNRNLLNLINFINSKSNDLNIYIPINILPGGLIPSNISGLHTEMTVQELGERFNIVDLENIPYKNLNKLGLYDYYLLMISTALLIITLILLILSVTPGMRFVAPGIGFILSGGVLLILYQLNSNLNKYIVESFNNTVSLSKAVVLTIAPPILTDIIVMWVYLGIGLVVIGFFFIICKKAKCNN